MRNMGLAPGAAVRDRLRVAIEGDHPPLRPQALQQRAAMPAAPKGAIDIDAVGARCERLDRLFEQHGNVRFAHSTTPSNVPARSSAESASIACCCACHPASDHNSKCVP